METSLSSFREEYHPFLLRLLWRQWSALGVAGYAASSDPWVIDPEALLLFSTEIARLDSRLFDEILDWLSDYASWISLQRLSRMRKEYQFGAGTVLSAVAEHLAVSSPHQKWKVLCGGNQPKDSESVERAAQPLFPTAGHFGKEDTVFLKWGWQRGPVGHRGLSVAPRVDQPAAFLLKLRSLFGRQSRAEIIAWLLAHESGHPAEIARQTGYYRRSVQLVLNELEMSGHIRSRRAGREKHFAIVHEQWRFLVSWKEQQTMPFEFPQWIHWPTLFAVLDRVHHFLNNPNLKSMSPSLQAIELRQALQVTHPSADLTPIQLHPPQHLTGENFIAATLRQLRQFLNSLDTGAFVPSEL